MIPRRVAKSREENAVRAALTIVADQLFSLLEACCDDGPFAHLTVARDRITKALAGPMRVETAEFQAKLEEWRRG